MSIHLRVITDESGDTIDYAWYCSRPCWLESLADEPISETFEEGGAYPCGAESDSPDFCAHCGDPVGNPLTDDGVNYTRELIASGGTCADALASTYDLEPLEDEPGEDDAYISPSGHLGARTSASFAGRHLGEFADDASALEAIRAAMRESGYYPDVWSISDHGNAHRVTLEID